ncbi:hypothetical protein [Acetobacter persici]|uniref:hypothetical protein n=1 Tax=Acetobacter persici TaxID=1076596 RepID=UPI001F18AF88|nr:hypothetical protein [Acetobacter persici]MCG0999147.1 hypothetical protein [Acetobacter persici]
MQQCERRERAGRGWSAIMCLLVCVLSGWGCVGAGSVQAAPGEASAMHRGVPDHIARCDLTAGRPAFCGAPYTGQAVLPEDGEYHLCDMTLGSARFCAGLYTGRAVIRQGGGGYARCDLTLGHVTFCEGPYTGTAIIPQSAE